MSRVPCTALLGAAALALGACGSDGDGGASTTQAAAAAPAPAKQARAAASGVKLVKVGSLHAPVYLTAPKGDKRRLYVVEQDGTIRVIRGGKRLAAPFLDIRLLVTAGGEQGLLSMAFAPDYAKTKRFYVNYSDKAGDQRVVEYRAATPDRANRASARTVLKYPGLEPNHNGGLIVFGPDRLLYIGTGDGGGANDQHGSRGNAQDLGSLLGKLLRINPSRSGSRPYSVPAGNPFAARAGARPEIYSYGLRNPWRFSFDRSTGDLVIADVGQNAVEEIDFATKGQAGGANYGWRPLEGTRRNFDEPAPGAVAPVLQLSHNSGNCSVTGGYVVRDRAVPPLNGRYIYADLCRGELRSVKLSAGSASGDAAVPGVDKIDQPSSFGEDGSGRVYVVSLGGPVYRLAAG